MNRTEALETIKRSISCTSYLGKSKSGLYACPFCGSGNGSHGTGALKVYDTNTFTCFSCNKSGDVIDIVQQVYGIGYNETIKALSEELHISIDEREKRPQNDSSKLDDKKPAQTAAAVKTAEKTQPERKEMDLQPYYEKCAAALAGSEGEYYLLDRGIDLATAAKYNLGFDPKCDISGKGYLEPRVIVPLNKTCYVGRSIIPNSDYPKPYNTGGKPTPFNVAALYAGNESVFIVEGWADAISIEICGGNAVALNSTNQANNFIDQLEQAPTESVLIISFDNDGNPNTAKHAQTLKNGLKRLGLRYIEADITGEYKDANDALRGNKEEFKRMIESAQAAAIYEKNRDDLTDFFEKIQTDAYRPVRTGLTFFDDLLQGGVVQQSLLLLMAAPGTGKTTLCQQLAERMAGNKKPIIYLNFEMSREQMFAKAISARVSKRGNKKTALDILQGYNWTDEDRAVIEKVLQEYREIVFPYIQYNPGNVSSDLDEILMYLKMTGDRAKAEGKQAPAVIVDYLHLISNKRGLDVQELIKQAVTGLKDYAKNYDTFVIGIVATNRASNSNGQITMDSGRDSSNIEYSGDYILSLNYREIDNGNIKAGEVEKIANLQQKERREMILRVLKGRFVSPGRSANLYFDAAHNLFYGEDKHTETPTETQAKKQTKKQTKTPMPMKYDPEQLSISQDIIGNTDRRL